MKNLMYLSLHRILLVTIPLLWICLSVWSQTIDANSIIAYPNPFEPDNSNSILNIKLKGNPPTDIPGTVQLTVYNSLLNQVYESTFTQGAEARWNGYDVNGNKVPSGIYFLRIIVTTTVGLTSKRDFKLIIK